MEIKIDTYCSVIELRKMSEFLIAVADEKEVMQKKEQADFEERMRKAEEMGFPGTAIPPFSAGLIGGQSANPSISG